MMNLESRKAGKDLRHRLLTDQIIGAAIRVHTELGPGFLESVYEQALAIEFDASNIRYARQKPVPLLYKGHSIGEHRLDFLVQDVVIVELKATRALEDIHFAVGRSYLKATNLEDGLLLNFATCPLTVRRITRERQNKSNAI